METYHIPASNVLRHKDTKPTECPGHYLSIDQVRRMASQVLADAGIPEAAAQTAAATELLEDVPATDGTLQIVR
jgi:N-acetylmuramoyl-L-alanine amidase CwlA